MDIIKAEPDSYEDYSLVPHSEGNLVCIKEEYVAQEPLPSEHPEKSHFKSILQCKNEEKEREEILTEENGIFIQHTNLLSDQSVTDADPVDGSSEDDAIQPLPWRVCGSDQQTLTNDNGRVPDGKEDAYCCGVCNRQFRWPHSFQRHLKAHSMFWCEDCNREFCSRLNLQLLHETEVMSSYVCEVCHLKFKMPGHLRQHVAQWHWRQKPYSCHRCAEGSAPHDSPLQCPVCKRNFTSYDYLRAHLKHHSKDKVYLCNTCNMQCFTLTMFKNHLEIHKEEKPMAPKMYKRKQNPLKGLTVSSY